jgi:flagellar motility protein MotE (MotC chaperone)
MKQIILPLVIALLMGLGGASGFSYVSAKKTAAIIAAHQADSVAKHVKDSTEANKKADTEAKATAATEESHIDSSMMTPADSIRLARHQPMTLRDATHGLTNAADPKQVAIAAKADAAAHADPKLDAKATDAKTKLAAPALPKLASTPDSPLPESRLAKIFGAMQSKDAARVLEQMNDRDVRVILGMMSDKQAAAIIGAFTPQHAAAISMNESAKPADKKSPGAKP